MTRSLLVALVLFLPGFALAQDAPVKTQIVLTDGTTIYADIKGVVFDVKTKFGLLKIPVDDLAVANLGYNLTEDETVKVKVAFDNLGSDKFPLRDAASRYLDKFGERALPFAPEANVTDLEQKRRIDQWRASTNPKSEWMFDYFEGEHGSIKGKILNKSIKVKHEILGDLTINTANLKSVANLISVKTTVTTDEEWKSVGAIPNGSKATVTATGEIDLWPMTPGQYKTTPKGYNTTGKGGQFMAGALIGKLNDGAPFVIGESKLIEQSGTLYLKIVENPWNGKSDGSYSVKIDRK